MLRTLRQCVAIPMWYYHDHEHVCSCLLLKWDLGPSDKWVQVERYSRCPKRREETNEMGVREGLLTMFVRDAKNKNVGQQELLATKFYLAC